MDNCDNCKKKSECAEKLCMPVDEFVKKSQWVDWTEISCDGFELL